MRDDMSVLFERPMARAEAQALIDGVSLYDGFAVRSECIRHYSFAVPCVEAVEALLKLSPLLEVGAGSGYWAKLLADSGADVVATDLGKQSDFSKFWNGGARVLQMGAVDAVRSYRDRNVLVCWPSYDSPWAGEMARDISPGRTLAYIGEGRGGCTADDGFFDVLDECFEEAGGVGIPRWDGIHDYLRFYVRK